LALDAKTGAYVNHFPIAPTDWHDWDVSNTPAIITTRGGKQLLSFAPRMDICMALIWRPTNSSTEVL
jgi:alcohol dehydrogenase (cytochrome c)